MTTAILPSQTHYQSSVTDVNEVINKKSNPLDLIPAASGAISAILAGWLIEYDKQIKNSSDNAKSLGIPQLKAPAAEPNANLLVKQSEQLSVTIAANTLALQDTTLPTEAQLQQPDFTMQQLRKEDLPEELQERLTIAEQILGGRLAEVMVLIVRMLMALAANKRASMEQSTNNSKISYGLAKVSAKRTIDSGEAQKNQAIATATVSTAMVAAGTVQSVKGINQQQHGLKTHVTRSNELNRQAARLDTVRTAHIPTVQSESGPTSAANNRVPTRPEAPAVTVPSATDAPELPSTSAGHTPTAQQSNVTPAQTQLVDEDAARHAQDLQVLQRGPNRLRERANAEGMEGERWRLVGQRNTQIGYAVTSSGHPFGGLAGAPFSVENANAQADKQMADSGSRVMSDSSAQRAKQADAFQAALAALIQLMLQIGSANNDAAGVIAQNIRA